MSAANLEKRGEGDLIAATSHSSVVSLAAARIVAKTPSVFRITSMFQKREDAKSPAAELGITNDVAAIFRMLAAIDFDNQLVLVADEVDDRPADRRLPAKLQPAQAPVTQLRLHPPFGIGRVLAHDKCEHAKLVVNCLAHLPPSCVMLALRVSPSPRFSKLAALVKRNGPPPPRGRGRFHARRCAAGLR